MFFRLYKCSSKLFKELFTERFSDEPKMIILWYHFENTLLELFIFKSYGVNVIFDIFPYKMKNIPDC